MLEEQGRNLFEAFDLTSQQVSPLCKLNSKNSFVSISKLETTRYFALDLSLKL